MDTNTKVIVLVGGPSKEAEVSRRTGNAICNALIQKNYNAVLLELNPVTVLADIRALKGEVVFNALHGKFGEDGALQGVLEMAGIPYTGSGITSCAVSMNKKLSKEVFVGAEIPTAKSIAYDLVKQDKSEVLADIQSNFKGPVVLKAATQGSSLGVAIVKEDNQLKAALDEVSEFDHLIIAEQYLSGQEYTVGLLAGKAMPVIMIVPHSGAYDYTSKYTVGATDYLCPAPISAELTLKIQEISERVYQVLQCEGVARVDLMTDGQGNLFVLELNSMPGMTETSLVPKAAKAMGLPFPELCESMLLAARINKY